MTTLYTADQKPNKCTSCDRIPLPHCIHCLSFT